MASAQAPRAGGVNVRTCNECLRPNCACSGYDGCAGRIMIGAAAFSGPGKIALLAGYARLMMAHVRTD